MSGSHAASKVAAGSTGAHAAKVIAAVEGDGELEEKGASVGGKWSWAWLGWLPGFTYVLLLYVLGIIIFSDPRAVLVSAGTYHLSWLDVLMLGASMMAMFELLRVSKPGVDNTLEAMSMVGLAVVQFGLWILGTQKTTLWGFNFDVFSNTEFLSLLLISATQGVVALMINSRTLKRSIST